MINDQDRTQNQSPLSVSDDTQIVSQANTSGQNIVTNSSSPKPDMNVPSKSRPNSGNVQLRRADSTKSQSSSGVNQGVLLADYANLQQVQPQQQQQQQQQQRAPVNNWMSPQMRPNLVPNNNFTMTNTRATPATVIMNKPRPATVFAPANPLSTNSISSPNLYQTLPTSSNTQFAYPFAYSIDPTTQTAQQFSNTNAVPSSSQQTTAQQSTLNNFLVNDSVPIRTSKRKNSSNFVSFRALNVRYFLFLIYVIILLSLIIHTFIHFIIFSTNMWISALFLEPHHRYELVSGKYYSLEVHNIHTFDTNHIYDRTRNYGNSHTSSSIIPPQSVDYIRCDRESFLNLLEEFYHQFPRANNDLSNDFSNESPIYGRPINFPTQNSSSKQKTYPKILSNLNNLARQNEHKKEPEPDDDQLFYSSSSTSNHRDTDWQNQMRNKNQLDNQTNRIVIIEILALILLFILVLNHVLGLIAVIQNRFLLTVFVTTIDAILFCILVYFSNWSLLILLLLSTLIGFAQILELNYAQNITSEERKILKNELADELRDVIRDSVNRVSPGCIHVSLETYEAMTQQMLQNRFSSPIVYCPHYNESIC